VHDELVLEVDPSMVAEAAKLLQICMENAASLLGIIFYTELYVIR
jgi:DNA polymerase theta